jgi:hypothetical protein
MAFKWEVARIALLKREKNLVLIWAIWEPKSLQANRLDTSKPKQCEQSLMNSPMRPSMELINLKITRALRASQTELEAAHPLLIALDLL